MKICFWTPYMGNVGTIKATINSAIALKKYYEEIKIFKIYREWEGYEKRILDNKIEIIDFNLKKYIKTLPQYRLGFRISMIIISFYSFFQLKKYYDKEKPDVIIASLLGYLPILVRSFSKHKPIIINSIQGLPRINIFRKILWNIFYRKSDKIIVLTRETKQEILKIFPFFENKIEIISNPIIDETIEILKKENIQDEILETNIPILIGIGRLTEQKDFITLIKACEIVLKKIKIKTIILGSGEKYKELQKYIIEKKLNKEIILKGFVSNPYKYINRADLFVLSSKWEDQGHTLIEAAYLKTPILSTKCPRGQEEFLEYGKLGELCEISNEVDMSKKIIYLLNRIKSKEILNKKELAYKKSLKFSIQSYGEKMKELIERIIEKDDYKYNNHYI